MRHMLALSRLRTQQELQGELDANALHALHVSRSCISMPVSMSSIERLTQHPVVQPGCHSTKEHAACVIIKQTATQL